MKMNSAQGKLESGLVSGGGFQPDVVFGLRVDGTITGGLITGGLTSSSLR